MKKISEHSFRSSRMSISRISLVGSACLLLLVTIATTERGTAAEKSSVKGFSAGTIAPTVDLFTGLERGDLEQRLVMKNEKEGTLYLKNMTKQPISVKLPEAAVGVQVTKQGGFGNGGGGGGFGGGGQGGGGFGGGGGGQSAGGGFGGGGQGGGGFGGGGLGGGGGGFGSIPPEKTVKIPFNSVCLEYGKANPNSRMRYQLIAVEKYTDDVRQQELLKLIASGRFDSGSAQAAAWNTFSKMPWDKIASLQKETIGDPVKFDLFNPNQLQQAQQMVSNADYRSDQIAKNGPKNEEKESRVRNRTEGAKFNLE
ncbi:MAG: hypothetical protein KDA68_08355 [Planctomycetaceae bacterium]|nr:hypothetical protein [Planctomycetaceae bacterium]